VSHDIIRRLTLLGLALCLLIAGGTVAYSLTEDQPLWESLTWTIDTVATTGSMRAPSDTAGQVVKVVLTFLGVGTLFYALVSLTELVVSGQLGTMLSERRARRMSERLTDHFIVCGFGRVGRQVARDLRAAGARYVVIDSEIANREAAYAPGVRFILARASDDEALREAGIERARAVIACVDSDAENIFISLTARELRPDIAIVARASEEEAENKLRRAGADRVISPYKSSGTEMARLALHPNVTGSKDVAAEYRLEEITVQPGSAGAERRVGDVRGGAFVVGVRHPDGAFRPQPGPETVLVEGDVVMAIGTPRTLERLEELFSGQSSQATLT
jgi:voltage-gated potassium channel